MNWLNSYKDKEDTEWSNFWYDEANVGKNDHRVLLIGDSIARQIRKDLSHKLKCPVSLFGTSAALRDQMFWDQWDCFFKNKLYKYEKIILWIGNHSRMTEDGTNLFIDSDYRRFSFDFQYLIHKCQSISNRILVLSTLYIYHTRNYNPIIELIRKRFFIKPKENINEQENKIVQQKNLIMQNICSRHNIAFYDIATELFHSKYWHKDHIHYINESNQFVVNLLKENLESI